MAEPDTEKITIRVPKRHLKALDFLVQIDDFPSRSEAIRSAVRDLIYARLELVVDRMKKFEHAEQSLAEIKTLEEKYLKK
jgi:Arc/MetJ-type ribon-helix-helix transcriptional regulator